MPAGRTVRVGIIGAGWVASDRHLPAYLAANGVEVVGVVDRHIDRAKRLAKAAGSSSLATTSLEELFALEPDLVSICTPPFAHREPAIAALSGGIAVFMEKPMAMSYAEAQEIAGAAARSSALLCVSHNFLFSRSMERIRRVIESGKAGPIQSVLGVQASSPKRRLPEWYGDLPGGLFWDESPHLLYLMASLLGPFELVSTVATRAPRGARQQIATVQALFQSPVAPGTLSMTFDAPVSEWYLLVTCQRRVFLVDLFRDISVVLLSDGGHRAHEILRTSISAGIQHFRGVVSTGMRIASHRQSWGHQDLIERMVDAVRTGADSPVPVSDSLQVARVMDDIVSVIHR